MFFRLIKEYAALIIYFILAVAVFVAIVFIPSWYDFFVDKFGKGGFNTLVTFFATIATIYLFYRKLKHTEELVDKQPKQLSHAEKLVAKQQKQLSQELLKNGIEHLASDKIIIRMGAITELKRLINTDSKESVIDTLMAFVRLTTSKDKYKEENPIPREDIKNILAIFTDKKYKKDLPTVDLNNAYLGEANLKGANLQRANLQRANLEGANLEGANLQGANLDGANLEGAYLEVAYLYRAILNEAYLFGVRLFRAELQGAFLMKADLRKANLRRAELQGAILLGADLQEANLQRAEFDKQTNFTGANLDGAIFSRQDKEEIEALGILDRAKNKDKIHWQLDYSKNLYI